MSDATDLVNKVKGMIRKPVDAVTDFGGAVQHGLESAGIPLGQFGSNPTPPPNPYMDDMVRKANDSYRNAAQQAPVAPRRGMPVRPH